MVLKIIAIVPARGGSKGVPRKNVKLLAEKPLISYTIGESLKSKYVTFSIVSTEDQEISNISKKYGANVVKRPEILSRDESPIIDVIFHVLEFLGIQREKQNIILLLQPTSPLRNSQDIDNAIELFLENECDSVISVCENKQPFWTFVKEDQYLKPIQGGSYLKMRRQDLPKSYIPNGAIFISTVGILQEYRSFYSSKILPYVMPPERSIDIDNELDFFMAEKILTQLIPKDNFNAQLQKPHTTIPLHDSKMLA
jgi:CMP-N,N'-diacetyllegionaminic acid synthase